MSVLPLFHFPASPCQRLNSRFFPGIELWVKRDDLLHHQVSGNKFRKLKYPLQALAGKTPCLVTMGGPWSNHLHATAHAAALLGWRSIGLVRGAGEVASATLDDCRQLGMHTIAVNREAYRQLRQQDGAWRDYINANPSMSEDAVWLPEGGSSAAALYGVAELVDESIDQLGFVPDNIMLACGTGATLAGALAGLRGRSQVTGIAVLKNASYLVGDIAELLQQAGYPTYENYQLLTEYHQGGYGKAPSELLQFCADFARETGIPVEPVYTGKLFYALRQMTNTAPQSSLQGQRILVIHTGGMQGARGFGLATSA